MALAKSLPPWMLLGIGVAAGWVKNFWSTIYGHTLGYVVRKLHVSMTIEDTQHMEAYLWLALWSEKKLYEKRISAVLLRRKKEENEEENDEARGSAFELIPDYGTYYLRWRKRYLMILTHAKVNNKSSGDDDTPSYGNDKHSFTISIWGTLNREALLDVVRDAKAEYDAAHPRMLYYYTNGSVNYAAHWVSSLLLRRTLDTIYLPTEQLGSILSDFQAFFDSKEKYRALGIPWRHGWLFHGPPGTGKSSLVQALSSHFNIPIHYLTLNAVHKAAELVELFRQVRTPGIVLIEDADCLQVMRDRGPEEKGKGLSTVVLSDLLNVLDGLVASEGRLLIMTTNYRDKLDAALLRAGRIDREFHLDYADGIELRRFHDGAKDLFNLPSYSEFRGLLPANCTIADAQVLMFKLQKDEEVLV